MNPLVSVIIPTFNRADLIQETLQSVLDQTYFNWECLVVDDGSTDNTRDLVSKWTDKDNRFQYFFSDNKGVSNARNIGIQKSKGIFILFLDSDDLVSNFCLEYRIKFANNTPEFDFWIFKMNVFENQLTNNDICFNYFNEGILEENEFYKNEFLKGKFPFAVTCPFWKKEKLILLNGFDRNLKMLEDPDLHLRAFEIGLKCKSAIHLEADCHYRVNIEKSNIEKSNYYSKIANYSNFYFLKKHFIQNNEYVKYNFKNIFNKFIFTNAAYRFNFKMVFFGMKNKIFTFKYALLSFIILVFISMGLNNFKRFGYNKLRINFNKF